jgi:hypothetical protein
VSSYAEEAGTQGVLDKTDATTVFDEYDEHGRILSTTDAPDFAHVTDVVRPDTEYQEDAGTQGVLDNTDSFGRGIWHPHLETEGTISRWPGWIRIVFVSGLLVALLLLGGVIYNQFGQQRAPIQEANSQVSPTPQREMAAALALPPTPTPTSTPNPTATPTPTAFALSQALLPANPPACVPPPVLFDPTDGKSFSARNMVLRWRSDYALKPGEEFEILISPEGAPEMTWLGTTTEKMLALDLMRWKYAGWFTKFNVLLRIKGSDARYLDCASKPVSFVLNDPAVGEQPARPEQPQQSGQPQQPTPRR